MKPRYDLMNPNPKSPAALRGMAGTRIGGIAGTYNPGTSGLTGLASQYQSQYDAARQANEARYQDILGGHGDLYGRVMGGLDTRSTQGIEDISRTFKDAAASGQQRMASRGLYGSTINETMMQGMEQKKAAAINRYKDDMLDRRLGYDVGLTGNRLGFMERREDEYPNQQALMSLAQMMGQAGPGGLPPEMMSLFQAMMGGGAPTRTPIGGAQAQPSGPRKYMPKTTGPGIINYGY